MMSSFPSNVLQTGCRTEHCHFKGFHTHHPRDCLFYLRDWETTRLQALLQMRGVEFNTEPSDELQAGTCGVMEQKDEGGQLVDSPCGIQTQPGQAGLCGKHYGEYLVSLINAHSLDPALLYDAHDLIRTCERHHVDTQRADNEDDDAYHARLRKVKSLNVSRQSCFFSVVISIMNDYPVCLFVCFLLKYDTNDFPKELSLEQD
ncbi:E3 ubiquitin-protein ligase RNF31-like, partial [Hippocampus comes]|uniref:E3 ubiquitin-protein ligase RNF31-like n=1 Tax=Hippocampus comes TaxID=109280 RepID=UPI00094F17C4